MNISTAGRLAPARAVKLKLRSRRMWALNIPFGIINWVGALKSITSRIANRSISLVKVNRVEVLQQRFATVLNRRSL